MSTNKTQIIFLFLLSICIQWSCTNKTTDNIPLDNEAEAVSVMQEEPIIEEELVLGAERFDAYLPLLERKRVALTVNQTSMVDDNHLADTLLGLGINVTQIFAPEHGFRGQADAGATVKDGKDSKTGLPIISLYGKNKKPSSQQLQDVDIVVFDIQDVGARFYTYISTMHYVMEACAEANIPVLVLDRPNPNGHYVDGPVLDSDYSSFVGMHQIPIVHGLTVAELARMINGEGWLKDGLQCNLTFVECKGYTHHTMYELPIKPSPNLPNQRSILLYPSLCLFEGTEANVGRGTSQQFQVVGHPEYPNQSFSYTPTSRSGAKYPKFKDKLCYGMDLSNMETQSLFDEGKISLEYLIDFYQQMPNKESFFLKNKFIDKLAGTSQLRKDIIAGKSASEIRKGWEAGLNDYKSRRKQYLLYEDFE